jgi:hypothetical protein
MTGTNFLWFDTIAGSGGLASTPGPTNGQAAAMVFGYWQAGDGGGGEFYWDPTSTLQADRGTVLSVAQGSGRWIRLYSGPLNVRWFGAMGDGKTDRGPSFPQGDTDAINNAIGTASNGTFNADGSVNADGHLNTDGSITPSPRTAIVYFPAGVYMVTGLTLQEWNSGITLLGAGTLAPGQPGPPPYIGAGSIIRLSEPQDFLLNVTTTCFRIENLWWDGNQVAQDICTIRGTGK